MKVVQQLPLVGESAMSVRWSAAPWDEHPFTRTEPGRPPQVFNHKGLVIFSETECETAPTLDHTYPIMARQMNMWSQSRSSCTISLPSVAGFAPVSSI